MKRTLERVRNPRPGNCRGRCCSAQVSSTSSKADAGSPWWLLAETLSISSRMKTGLLLPASEDVLDNAARHGSRYKCGGDRESRLHRADLPETFSRICASWPWQCSCPDWSCRLPEDHRGRESDSAFHPSGDLTARYSRMRSFTFSMP